VAKPGVFSELDFHIIPSALVGTWNEILIILEATEKEHDNSAIREPVSIYTFYRPKEGIEG